MVIIGNLIKIRKLISLSFRSMSVHLGWSDSSDILSPIAYFEVLLIICYNNYKFKLIITI